MTVRAPDIAFRDLLDYPFPGYPSTAQLGDTCDFFAPYVIELQNPHIELAAVDTRLF